MSSLDKTISRCNLFLLLPPSFGISAQHKRFHIIEEIFDRSFIFLLSFNPSFRLVHVFLHPTSFDREGNSSKSFSRFLVSVSLPGLSSNIFSTRLSTLLFVESHGTRILRTPPTLRPPGSSSFPATLSVNVFKYSSSALFLRRLKPCTSTCLFLSCLHPCVRISSVITKMSSSLLSFSFCATWPFVT